MVSTGVTPESKITTANRPRALDSRLGMTLLSLLLFLSTLAVYYPVHTHPFFDPDDSAYLTRNAHVQAGLSWTMLAWAFRSHDTNWHPLTWISHAADFAMFGLDPAPHHLMNVLFHALNVLLLFWVLQRATGFAGRSFMVAALFALHPINVEPVVWVAERKTLLSTLFFLLALGAYRWYTEQPKESRYWLTAGLFILGLLAKPQIVAFPVLLLFWDYWPLGRMFSQTEGATAGTQGRARLEGKTFSWLLKEKISLFAFAAADALMTIQAQGVTSRGHWTLSLRLRLENAIVSYVLYLKKALVPAGLAPYYPHPGNSLTFLQVFASLLLLLAITAAVWAARRRRYFTVGWLWFLVAMVPMIGIVQVGKQAMADRYAYQPFVGLFLMACWGIAEWSLEWRFPRALLPAASVVLLVALAVTCRHQINYWTDELTLWSHTLDVSHNNLVAEYRVAEALEQKGDVGGAMQHFRQAWAVDPQEPYVNLQLAIYEHQHGNLAAALAYYKAVVTSPQYDPTAAKQAYGNMGHIYSEQGDVQQARECWQKANQIPITDFDVR